MIEETTERDMSEVNWIDRMREHCAENGDRHT